MNINEHMLKELNKNVDLLERAAKHRSELTKELLSILDAKNAVIGDLHDQIAQLQSAIKKHCD